MISQIGNSPNRPQNLQKNGGLSFFETMVAVVILSSGLVFIYKAFFIALDYTEHLKCRLYANVLLDEKISSLERLLQDQNQIPFSQGKEIESVQVENRKIDFQYTIDLRGVENMKGLFEINISIGWQQGKRWVSLSRDAYIFNPKPLS